MTNPVWYVALASLLAVVPIIIGVTTSYLKVSIVFGLLKSALGTQQVPGVMVTMSLAIAVTTFVMAPVFEEVVARASTATWGDLTRMPQRKQLDEAARVVEPIVHFLRTHTGVREQEALAQLEGGHRQRAAEHPAGEPAEIGWRSTILGFVLTELREAFMMGLMLLLPFLAIDLIVSNILVGLGMFMVSPTMISLPLKLLLFVLADGWLVLTRALITSYGVGV